MSRASRERMEQAADDASTSGTIPIIGMFMLVMIIAAVVRMIL